MLNKDEIKVNQKVLVTVTTSSDVDYVTINGEKVEKYTVGLLGKRTWKLNVTGTEVGTLKIGVVCYNENEVASRTQTKYVSVKRPNVWDLVTDLFD